MSAVRKQKRPVARLTAAPVKDIFVATGPDSYLCADCINETCDDDSEEDA
jgi:hypothetical protein